jgi:hypothetical protein
VFLRTLTQTSEAVTWLAFATETVKVTSSPTAIRSELARADTSRLALGDALGSSTTSCDAADAVLAAMSAADAKTATDTVTRAVRRFMVSP